MKISILFILCVLFFFSACSKQVADFEQEFSFPAGDVERGEKVFLAMDCLACHTLEGYDSEEIPRELENPIILANILKATKTYGELVASVVNPSHKVSSGYRSEGLQDGVESAPVRNYNDVLTVAELIDLISFLEQHYTLKPFKYTEYPVYYP